jgi:alpha-tubulin suppressor-like RCC1 family protein
MPRSRSLVLLVCGTLTMACGVKDIAADSGSTDEGDDDPGPPRIAHFTVGSLHACVIEDQVARCWGANNLGQLGDGSTDARAIGVTPMGPERFVDISAGSYHTCAVDGEGAAWCWGDGINGVLGDGSGDDQPLPVKLDGIPPLVAISTEFVHTCALSREGEVWCWGENNQGQLGIGEISFGSLTPVQVQELSGVVEVSVGERHSCARLDDGGLRCWGDNGYGELGDGTRDNRALPVPVASCPALDIDAGSFRTCVICEDRSVQCWGDNWGGHLLGDEVDFIVDPAVIPGLSNIVAISTAWAHACAVDESDRVWCWGRNKSGERGDGTLEPRVEPATASGSSGATLVVATGTPTGAITCVNTPNALLACAGDTSGGQLGTDPTVQTLILRAVGE